VVGVMGFTFFGTKADASNEGWTRFIANEPRLFDFESNQERIFDELGRELELVNSDLTFDEAQKGTYGQIGYLFLDEALGEYAVETQVGFVEFHSKESKYFGQSHPLRELPGDFDAYVGRRVR